MFTPVRRLAPTTLGRRLVLRLAGWCLSYLSFAVVDSVILPALTDEELVELSIQRGGRDERPFRELMRRHRQMIWRTSYSFVRNSEDADDLTQDIFFKAYRNLHTFAGRASFKTWLNRIAINTSQNEVRRRSRRPQESEADIREMAEYLPGSESASVESMVRQRALSQHLQQALTELRPEEFEVIFLRDVEERPYAEIADILGIGLSAAKMRVQRARLALQVAYRQVSGDDQTL